MNIFLYADSDSVVSRHKLEENINMGFDEVLDIENKYDETTGHHVSRMLIQFEIDNSGIDKQTLLNSEFFLNLKITESQELLHKSVLQTFPLLSSWVEGPGRKHDTNINYNGVTWNVRNDASTPWNEAGGDYIRYIEDNHGLPEDMGCEFEFNKRTSDVSINITKIAKRWLSGDFDNNGLIVKFKDETTLTQGKVSFFSKDTNTIYSPYLRVAHDDYYFNPCECLVEEKLTCETQEESDQALDNIISGSLISGSLISGSLISGSLISGSLISGSLISGTIENKLKSVNSTECVSILNRNEVKTFSNLNHITSNTYIVTIKDIKKEYSVKETLRMRVGVRETYPKKTFKQKSEYSLNNFVEFPLYYSIRDADTHEVRVTWDSYSRINCDALGHYFDFDFGCLSVGRIYEFSIRAESESETRITQIKTKFMVIN